MSDRYYLNRLYPLQDKVLASIREIDVDFYLSGGTALSRAFLRHRHSDDLDFFLNSDPDFKPKCEMVLNHLRKKSFEISVATAADSFLRVFLTGDQARLKIDFINDVSFHFGGFEKCDFFERVDNWRNILSNKICALSRMEPKDYADVLFIAKKYVFFWEDIIEEAKKKDLWVEPIEVSRMINAFPAKMMSRIKWIHEPDIKDARESLASISEDILMGRENSLAG